MSEQSEVQLLTFVPDKKQAEQSKSNWATEVVRLGLWWASKEFEAEHRGLMNCEVLPESRVYVRSGIIVASGW